MSPTESIHGRVRAWRYDIAERLINWERRWLEGEPDNSIDHPKPRHRLQTGGGIDLSDKFGAAYAIDRERSERWPRLRSPVAIAMRRFCDGRDCREGMMLVEAADRFALRHRDVRTADVVLAVPGPDRLQTIDPISWLVARVDFPDAEKVIIPRRGESSVPESVGSPDRLLAADVLQPTRPIPDPADRARLPKGTDPDELWDIDPAAGSLLAGKRVLIVDLHWHRGQGLAAIARKLRAVGAASVARLVWLYDPAHSR